MDAFVKSRSTSKPAWHAGFLELLPEIRSQISFAFRGFTPETCEEAIQESLALALDAYKKLFEQGRADIAYAAPLANYAARQFRAGRRVVGGQLNRNDVLSSRAQRHHNLVVERIDRRDPDGSWKETLIEDRGFTPAETAAIRIDFAEWLSRLCRRDRGVATSLAAGENGRDTAKLHGITAGRVAQIRAKLRRNWEKFQGEPMDELAMTGC